MREEQGTHTFYKFRLELPTGETRIANIAIAPLVTRDFAAVGRIILVDDITDRMELEAQLTQAEKLSSIGLLAAGVAHEVNTPLAVISSYTQMLAKQMRGRSRTTLAPVLEKITQQTFRASEIVNGLLNFSRTGGAEFTQRRPEPAAARHADAAGASVQDGADSRRDRPRCESAAHPAATRASCSRWS